MQPIFDLILRSKVHFISISSKFFSKYVRKICFITQNRGTRFGCPYFSPLYIPMHEIIRANTCKCQTKPLSLHSNSSIIAIMATYTITLNERTAKGKALIEYLKALGVLMHKVSPKAKSSYLRSQEDKQAGRVEKFSSSEEMFKSLGI